MVQHPLFMNPPPSLGWFSTLSEESPISHETVQHLPFGIGFIKCGLDESIISIVFLYKIVIDNISLISIVRWDLAWRDGRSFVLFECWNTLYHLVQVNFRNNYSHLSRRGLFLGRWGLLYSMTRIALRKSRVLNLVDITKPSSLTLQIYCTLIITRNKLGKNVIM